MTKTLSGVLNGLAGNIDTVATAAGALVAVGVADILAIWRRLLDLQLPD
ncbi:hypothetical protein ACR0Q7_14550 [Enterococcus faecalis]